MTAKLKKFLPDGKQRKEENPPSPPFVKGGVGGI